MTPTAASESQRRLYWLDNARGIAVLLVVLLHATELTVPFVKEHVAPYVGPGQIGVSVFFLVSGYIIPASIRPGAPARDFWIGRALRILPLYLLSIVAYSLFESVRVRAGFQFGPINPAFDPHNPRHLIGNALPWQNLFRVPPLVGLYWTLAIETMFYIVAFLLTWTKLADRFWRAVPVLAGIGIVAAIGLWALRPGASVPSLLYWLSIIFVGWSVRRWEKGAPIWTVGAVALFAIVLAALNLPTREDAAAAMTPAPLITNLLIALAIGSAIYLRREAFHRKSALAVLGLVSYSVYLDHGLALGLASFVTNPWLFLPLVALFTAALTALTYRFVELPAQGIAKRLRSRPASTEAAAVESHSGAV